MEGASEKNAKMRAVAKRRAGSEFDEDRTSRGRVVMYRGGKRGFERGTTTRERSGGRADTNGNGDGRRDERERRPRGYGIGRTRMSEREENGG